MRICHMIPGFFPIAKGGAEIFALNLCKELQIRGIDTVILTRNLNLLSKERYMGIDVRRFRNILPNKFKFYGFGQFIKSKYIRMVVAIFDLFTAIPALYTLFKEKRFQVVHSSFILPFGLVGLFVKKLLKIKIIITVHGPADFYEVPHLLNPILKFILKRVDSVVVVSPKLKKDLRRKLGKLPLKLICNGIQLEAYKSKEITPKLENYGIISSDFLILTAGRLVKRKNLELLFQSIPKILEKIPESKFVVLGSGIERNKLLKLADKLQIKSALIMPGWVSEEDKVEIFKRANVFIQLSSFEGLSLAVLESMAAGIPIIIVGSKNKDMPIKDGETGLLIELPLTIEKIISRIEYLYQNPDLCIKIGNKIKNEAWEKYNLDQMVENYIRIYQEILNK